MNKNQNSNSSAGTAADSSAKPKLQPPAKLLANPMLVAVKYNLVVCLDLKEIIEVVNEAIKEGWLPVGGLIYAEGRYVQTIVSA